MPRRSAARTREALIAAAYDLFYAQGYARVGVDDVAARAGVTKRTLYQHFASKDDLAGAAAERAEALAGWAVGRWAERLARTPEDAADALFDELETWVARPGFAGAGFTRVAMELADLPGHAVRRAARVHKAVVADALSGALGSRDKATAMMVVLEGTLVLALLSDAPSALAAGRALARAVVRGITPPAITAEVVTT